MTEQSNQSDHRAPSPLASGGEPFPDELLGLPGRILASGQGTELFIACQGAQVLSWRDRNGRERLYLSPQTGGYRRGDSLDALNQPIRGGIPVSFPQFSGRGPLPKHGFARNVLWQLASPQANQPARGTNTAALTLLDNAQTRAIWPNAFQTEVTASIEAGQLSVSLAITNTGTTSWAFTTALHTYLRVADIHHTALSGLQGIRFQDATAASAEAEQKEKELRINGEVDRVYMTPPGQLVLLENGAPSLQIEQEGFFDTVVWNPGPANARALKDFPDADWQQMLCVEAACAAHPVTLAPGETWRGRQLLTAVAPAS